MAIKLNGIIDKVTYFNESNNFGIVRIKLDYRDHNIAKFKSKLFNEYLNVTSTFERKPSINEEYDFEGEFISNSYGLQLKASSAILRDQNTLEGVVAFLSSDFFKGIGKVTATNIYNSLGENCISLIENNKDILNNVKGITEQQKCTIYEGIKDNSETRKAIIELLKIGLTMKLSLKLIKNLGVYAIDIIKENPYQLINEVDGIGFQKADKIALTLGIDKSSPMRIKELIMYLVYNYTYSTGNTYITKELLSNNVMEYINKEENVISNEILDSIYLSLASENRIFIDNNNQVFDIAIYKAENYLSMFIHRILNTENKQHFSKDDIDKCIESLKNTNNITYNKMQLKAIYKSLEEQIVIITGGPGTGKSTIVKAIKDSYAILFGNDVVLEQVVLLAPTGRAAKRLYELTHHPAMTIHKFLGYEGHGKYKYGFGETIFCKMVIVDEFSMVDTLLAARLFSALEEDTKIIIVGDKDQLPSVGPGNVLEDLIDSKEITTIRLNQIHRQSEGSSIIDLAHCVNEGIVVDNLLEKQNDRNFIQLNDEQIISGVIKTIEQGLSNGMDLINDIQVLVPMYKGDCGINAINSALQERFNPLIDYEYAHLNRHFRCGDKILQLVNRSEKKVMNGDIGYIIKMNFEFDDFKSLDVQYDFGIVNYVKDELEDITHAYAISIHKAQGSEFKLVIMPFSFKYYIMLKRKLIYTGITRAKKYLIMLGNVQALMRGVVDIEERRKTNLQQKIQKNFNSKIIDDKISAFKEIKENMENLSPYDFLD